MLDRDRGLFHPFDGVLELIGPRISGKCLDLLLAEVINELAYRILLSIVRVIIRFLLEPVQAVQLYFQLGFRISRTSQ